MATDTTTSLIALIGVAVPLMTIAGSAIAYVLKYYSEAKDRRRNQFFDLMKIIDGQGSIASKVAAVYQLRKFPEHRDFVIRFCYSASEIVTGDGGQPLVGEFMETARYMEALPDHEPSWSFRISRQTGSSGP